MTFILAPKPIQQWAPTGLTQAANYLEEHPGEEEAVGQFLTVLRALQRTQHRVEDFEMISLRSSSAYWGPAICYRSKDLGTVYGKAFNPPWINYLGDSIVLNTDFIVTGEKIAEIMFWFKETPTPNVLGVTTKTAAEIEFWLRQSAHTNTRLVVTPIDFEKHMASVLMETPKTSPGVLDPTTVE